MTRVMNLRSDTVTQPTAAMRRAMAAAEVGDDYYRDDPTVRALEEKAASMFGKEAAMLVFSATMANLVSVLSQTSRGHSVIVDEASHIYNNEAGFLAAFAGVTPRAVRGVRGRMTPAQVKAAGGCCLSLQQVRELCATAASLGLKVHLDGARIFNAAVRLGVSVKELTAPGDSVTVCLTNSSSTSRITGCVSTGSCWW